LRLIEARREKQARVDVLKKRIKAFRLTIRDGFFI